MSIWTLLLSVLPALALPADPAAALAEVDQRAAALERVRFAAVRTTIQGEVRAEERWVYVSESGGHFRIDYVGDTPRRIASDGKFLWDYIPAAGAAQRVDLGALSPEDRADMLGRVLSRVSIPCVRTGIEAASMNSVAWGADTVVDGRPARTVIATDDKGGRLSFVLDAERGALLSSTIEQNGTFVVSTEAHDLRQVAPGLWIPYRVRSTSPGPGGNVRVELNLLQLVVGQDLPDPLFSLTLDPSVSVRNLP